MSEAIENSEGGPSILVVEDEYFIAVELRNVLKKNGYEVLGPVSSVNKALELLKDHRPDAAVLDVNLGTEKVTPVAVHLKVMGVPYILATASDAAELARYPALTDVPCVGKPTNPKLLIEAIQATIKFGGRPV
jgi:DNA-binding response OmpR family regulator